jgi:Protein of unknown function (DUF4031)
VTVLVDQAVWPWRGDLWAHLVSDEALDELHAFAEGLGLRRLGFQGDHYDVSRSTRERAIALGAEPVDARDLVRSLREAGLRLRPGDRRPVRWQAAGERELEAGTAGSTLAAWASLAPLAGTPAPVVDAMARDGRARLAVFTRPRELAVVIEGARPPASVRPVELTTHLVDLGDRWSLEVFR